MVRWAETYRGQHQQLEDARETGERIDGYDDERPHLNPYQRWLWARFQELSSQRADGFGEVPQALAIAEIRGLWEWFGLEEFCPREEFLHWMRLLDRETRLMCAEIAEKRRKDKEDES